MLRHVMTCHVMSCHVMSCHVTLRRVAARLDFFASGWFVFSRPVPFPVESCHVMSCRVVSCRVVSCHVMFVFSRRWQQSSTRVVVKSQSVAGPVVVDKSR